MGIDNSLKDLRHDLEHEYSHDHAANVRAAREAAEREMRKFGDVSEYEIRKVIGQRADLNYDDENVPAPNSEAERVHIHNSRIHVMGEEHAHHDSPQQSFNYEHADKAQDVEPNREEQA